MKRKWFVFSGILGISAFIQPAIGNEFWNTPSSPDSTVAATSSGTLDLFDLSLEELMNVEISTASLTETTKRKMPMTLTIITRQQILQSGARSLIELLEIYVPNFQWIFTGTKPRHMGLRGIIGKDDKYLLLVNGRQMNEKTDFGVYSERDLPMLRDIQRIEVIRGPGSALYGAGALSMVINLIVDTPRTFEGTEVTFRSGFVEEYYSTEFKWGKMFSENEGLLLYAGGTYYPGADENVSPIRYCCGPGAYREGGPSGWWGTTNQPGYELGVDEYYHGDFMKNYNQAYRDRPKVKLHLHYSLDDFDIWARYTQGGEYVDQCEYRPLDGGWPQRDIPYGVGYAQGTVTAEYKQELSDTFNLQYRFSYDLTQFESSPWGFSREVAYREDEYNGRLTANWDLHEKHKLAFGGEWSHEEFGLDPIGEDKTLNYVMGNIREMPRWGTDMRSLFGEYQWVVSDWLTAFFSARLDDHTFVEQMFSPRGTLVFTPSKEDTIKIMLARASRTDVAENMKRSDMAGKSNSDYETLDAFEIRYERQHDQNLWLAVGYFMHDQDLVSYSSSLGGTGLVANLKSFGAEGEILYKINDRFEFSASQTYTQLDDVTLFEGITSIEETAAYCGMGNNFANWANHETKLRLVWHLNDRCLLTSSAIFYWGWPGGKDYARLFAWSPARFDQKKGLESFDPSYFWNMGLEYKYSSATTIRLDAYNILGWFDKDLGKRKFGFTNDFPGMYRIQPAAFGLQIIHTF
ncbi:MAG: TonB-dependent receptor plug domain-containing protein [Phycisphaerae bacterium]|nr:TonB-dependent receptor plug domain-containing protein [Phycisphaerae bacterium]